MISFDAKCIRDWQDAGDGDYKATTEMAADGWGHWFYQKVLVERQVRMNIWGSSKDDHAIQLECRSLRLQHGEKHQEMPPYQGISDDFRQKTACFVQQSLIED